MTRCDSLDPGYFDLDATAPCAPGDDEPHADTPSTQLGLIIS